MSPVACNWCVYIISLSDLTGPHRLEGSGDPTPSSGWAFWDLFLRQEGGGGGTQQEKLLRSVVVTSRYFLKGNLRGELSSRYILIYVFPHRSIMKVIVYYPPEGRRGKYWGWGVILLQYFLLVKM